MIPNVRVEGGSAVAKNNTHIAKVNTKVMSLPQPLVLATTAPH